MGRTRILTEKQREKARAMKAQGLKYREIADYFRVHPDTIRYQINPWYIKVADRTELTAYEKGVWATATKKQREMYASNPKLFVKEEVARRRREAHRALIMELPVAGKTGTSPG